MNLDAVAQLCVLQSSRILCAVPYGQNKGLEQLSYDKWPKHLRLFG